MAGVREIHLTGSVDELCHRTSKYWRVLPGVGTANVGRMEVPAMARRATRDVVCMVIGSEEGSL
jgi:hypothetical protein